MAVHCPTFHTTCLASPLISSRTTFLKHTVESIATFNEPLYNKLLRVMNDILQPAKVTVNVQNTIWKLKRKTYPDINE